MTTISPLVPVARRLEGKVAIVTGGASGIGESIARLFSKHGAKVVIADIQDDLSLLVCNDIGAEIASFVHCDVSIESDVENAITTAVEKYGKLDIMINNAGVVGDCKQSIIDNDLADFERIIRVNLIGTFLGTKHAARVMIPARKGSIISIASVSSIAGGCAPHSYTSSKHGVLGLAKNTAVELGQFGIRVNCVSPYLVATKLLKDFLIVDDDEVHGMYSNLKGAVLKAEDVAEAVLYLGSDESKYVSGHNLVVDGGFTIVNPRFTMFDLS